MRLIRHPTSNQPRRLDGIRVLIVEDDIASADALRELLEEEGAERARRAQRR